MNSEIQCLQEKWEDFIEIKGEEKVTCERCNQEVYIRDHDSHYWKRHFFWMFCRRTGLHWKMYQVKNLRGMKK